MDAARFGRALGIGTREAAKALTKAADAAMAPNPARGASAAAARVTGGRAGRKLGGPAVRGAVQASAVQVSSVKMSSRVAGLRRGGKRFGEAVWAPFVRLSGVLWLELTGVFFGLFAVTAGVEAWRRRGDLGGNGSARQHVFFALAMLLLFGYFTVTSFVRASRRGRR